MDKQKILDYCGAKPGATRDFPFDAHVLTFKVMNKIFALVNLKKLDSISLKCEPALAKALRQRYAEVTPGYHLHKKH